MQRIFNIQKWTRIAAGKAMHFKGDRYRRVNLEVNAPAPVKLMLVTGKQSRFLALVCGRDTVEFYVDGDVGIAADGGEVFVYTVDGDKWVWEDVDPESYTVVKERRERNYELEMIAMKMAENMNKRLEQQAHEISASLERRLGARQREPSPTVVAAGARQPPLDSGEAGDTRPARTRGSGDDDRGGPADQAGCPRS